MAWRSRSEVAIIAAIVQWIDENLHPDTGDWISRTRLKSCKDGTWDAGKGGIEVAASPEFVNQDGVVDADHTGRSPSQFVELRFWWITCSIRSASASFYCWEFYF